MWGTPRFCADDTKLFCITDEVDMAVVATNRALSLINEWCNNHTMTLHPKKCQAMLISRKKFVGPVPPLTINNNIIKMVKSTRCLGINIDEKMSWTSHLQETVKSFAKKLNLLKSLKFLPSFKVSYTSTTDRCCFRRGL